MPKIRIAHRCAAIAGGILFFASAYSVARDNSVGATLSIPGAASAITTNSGRISNQNAFPLHFEPNQGQFNSDVAFAAHGEHHQISILATEFSLYLQGNSGPSIGVGEKVGSSSENSVIKLRWLGGDHNAKAVVEQPLESKSHYFLESDPSKWRTNVPHYGRIRYQNVYPGIDVVYYANGADLEYDLEVHPGADPSKIVLEVSGAKAVAKSDGSLRLHAQSGILEQHAPKVFQQHGNERRPVGATLQSLGGERYGFKLAAYDATKRLIIDPVISYATYVGGTGTDMPSAIAVDPTGNVVIAGTTTSINFGTPKPYDPGMPAGSRNGLYATAFIAKLDSTGKNLLYVAFFGGSNGTSVSGLALDAAGNAYLGGMANASFPTTAGAFQTTYLSGNQTPIPFALKLNQAGDALLYSTYVGNSGPSGLYTATGLAVQPNGVAVHVGSNRFNVVHPVTPGVLNATPRTSYITAIKADGSGLVYSTYFGGSTGATKINAVAVDSTGNAYVTGQTNETDLPVAGAIQSALNGSTDAFISKINPTGTALVYSTYLGGGNRVFPNCQFGDMMDDESGNAIAVDASGNAYVGGHTFSDNGFPGVDTPIWDGGHGSYGFSNAFLVKLNPAGSSLLFSGLMGGDVNVNSLSCADRPTLPQSIKTIALDSQGNVFATGTDVQFVYPTTPPTKSSFRLLKPLFTENSNSGFVFAVTSNGRDLLFSSRLPGPNRPDAQMPSVAIKPAIDAASNLYLLFDNRYGAVPFPGTVQTGGMQVVKLSFPAVAVTLTSSSANVEVGQPVTYSAQITGNNTTGVVTFLSDETILANVNAGVGGMATFTGTAPSTFGVRSISAVYKDSTVPWGITSPILQQAISQPLVCN